MRKRATTILAVLVLCCALLYPITAGADFGDFSGSSDYGGGSSSSSSSSSSWDSDDYGSSGGGGGGDLPTPVVIIILGFFAFMFIYAFRTSKKKPSGGATGGTVTDVSKLRSLSEYNALDPGFDATALRETLSNLYVRMQNAWTAKDIEPVRPYFSDALYQQMDRQLNAYREGRRTNYVERIAVLGLEIRGWYQEGGNDCMVASVRTRIVDYTLNDVTGELISGDRAKEKFMEYEWILQRPTGQVTVAEGDTASVHCPSCGAPLTINQSARCPYCDSVVTVAEHSWVLFAMKGISQRTGN